MTAHLVQSACALPDQRGRSLSLWDCQELARHVVAAGVVDRISAETVRRRLAAHALKPWRFHDWLTPTQPRDGAFAPIVQELCDLYPRPLTSAGVVLGVDEKTSIQPRPRAKTPAAVERAGAGVEGGEEVEGAVPPILVLDGQCHRRKRAAEFIAFLRFLDEHLDVAVTQVHLVRDNLRTHKTQAWLAAHPRFVLHFTPVHCSWLNQVEQWFALLTRKRLRLAAFASLDDLHLKLRRFISEWNTQAHPFRWTTASFAKVLANCAAATTSDDHVPTAVPPADVPIAA